MSENIYIYPP